MKPKIFETTILLVSCFGRESLSHRGHNEGWECSGKECRRKYLSLTGTKQRNSGENRIGKDLHDMPCLEDQIENEWMEETYGRGGIRKSENLQARDHLEYLDEGGKSN